MSKLVESVDEGSDGPDGHEDQNEYDRVFYAGWNTPNNPSKPIGQNGNASKSAMNRSADEQLPSSMCFVRLSDMSADEWDVFLEKFQELLKEALHESARAAAGQRMKQRLGTSCKF